jgi:serine/threonine-protein kinase HipA
MHLAALRGLVTVLHSLLLLEGRALARRTDRLQGRKLAMEDMCQLTERVSGHKYDSSH